MPITQFLDGHHFDIETKRVMGLAFEMARTALRLDDGRDNPLNRTVAEKIIELAQDGERDPNALTERTLSFIGSADLSLSAVFGSAALGSVELRRSKFLETNSQPQCGHPKVCARQQDLASGAGGMVLP